MLFGKYVSYHILFLFQLSMPPFLGLCRRICCCVCTFPAIHHYPDRFSNCLFRNNIHLMALRNLCRLFGSLNRTFICTSVFCCVLYLNIIIMTIIFTNKIYLFGPKVFFIIVPICGRANPIHGHSYKTIVKNKYGFIQHP